MVLAKLGTGFVANNPLALPPTNPTPPCYNCTKTHSIICTALRCGNNPPNILRLRRGLESWLADFFIHSTKIFHRKNSTIASALFPWTLCDWLWQDFEILGNVSRKAISHHRSPCKSFTCHALRSIHNITKGAPQMILFLSFKILVINAWKIVNMHQLQHSNTLPRQQ